MLESLITSKTRIRLLMKFFLNSNQTAYLRGLSSEFGESTNAIRLELNRFEKAGLIKSSHEGNKKLFKANVMYPLYKDIHNILMKHTGIDKIINDVVKKLGNVARAWLIGDMATGHDSHTIEIVLIGENIDADYLKNLKGKAEKIIKKIIKTNIISPAEEKKYFETESPSLLIWEKL
ncbi:MAG: ArsR family transcriptional regulator [Bacteroidetes bacterium]|nr:ArsR family transcriptional regulator [Bacteroidota bacterium]